MKQLLLKAICSTSMELTFGAVEELKRAREKAFLDLTPSQRVTWFLRSIEQNASYATNRKPIDKGNYIIQLKSDWNSSSTKDFVSDL